MESLKNVHPFADLHLPLQVAIPPSRDPRVALALFPIHFSSYVDRSTFEILSPCDFIDTTVLFRYCARLKACVYPPLVHCAVDGPVAVVAVYFFINTSQTGWNPTIAANKVLQNLQLFFAFTKRYLTTQPLYRYHELLKLKEIDWRYRLGDLPFSLADIFSSSATRGSSSTQWTLRYRDLHFPGPMKESAVKCRPVRNLKGARILTDRSLTPSEFIHPRNSSSPLKYTYPPFSEASFREKPIREEMEVAGADHVAAVNLLKSFISPRNLILVFSPSYQGLSKKFRHNIESMARPLDPSIVSYLDTRLSPSLRFSPIQPNPYIPSYPNKLKRNRRIRPILATIKQPEQITSGAQYEGEFAYNDGLLSSISELEARKSSMDVSPWNVQILPYPAIDDPRMAIRITLFSGDFFVHEFFQQHAALSMLSFVLSKTNLAFFASQKNATSEFSQLLDFMQAGYDIDRIELTAEALYFQMSGFREYLAEFVDLVIMYLTVIDPFDESFTTSFESAAGLAYRAGGYSLRSEEESRILLWSSLVEGVEPLQEILAYPNIAIKSNFYLLDMSTALLCLQNFFLKQGHIYKANRSFLGVLLDNMRPTKVEGRGRMEILASIPRGASAPSPQEEDLFRLLAVVNEKFQFTEAEPGSRAYNQWQTYRMKTVKALNVNKMQMTRFDPPKAPQYFPHSLDRRPHHPHSGDLLSRLLPPMGKWRVLPANNAPVWVVRMGTRRNDRFTEAVNYGFQLCADDQDRQQRHAEMTRLALRRRATVSFLVTLMKLWKIKSRHSRESHAYGFDRINIRLNFPPGGCALLEVSKEAIYSTDQIQRDIDLFLALFASEELGALTQQDIDQFRMWKSYGEDEIPSVHEIRQYWVRYLSPRGSSTRLVVAEVRRKSSTAFSKYEAVQNRPKFIVRSGLRCCQSRFLLQGVSEDQVL